MAVRAKLTIRLDDEPREVLERICDLLGVSVTAYVQASIEWVQQEFAGEGWKSPAKWRDADAAVRYLEAAERAQAIDDERKRRGITH